MTFNKNERLRRAIHDNSRKLSLYRMRFLPHVCPERAGHPNRQDIHHMFEVIEHERTGCGDCLPYCPEPGALTQYEQSDLVR